MTEWILKFTIVLHQLLLILQVDWVEKTSWQAQLSGVKTWLLVPPPECEHVCRSFNVTVDTGDISK